VVLKASGEEGGSNPLVIDCRLVTTSLNFTAGVKMRLVIGASLTEGFLVNLEAEMA